MLYSFFFPFFLFLFFLFHGILLPDNKHDRPETYDTQAEYSKNVTNADLCHPFSVLFAFG